MTTLPPSGADCLEILELQTPGTLWACARITLPFLPQNEKRGITMLCAYVSICPRISDLKLNKQFLLKFQQMLRLYFE